MELRHLRYFVAAAEQEHFHRAAERLHIVQPALSRQIRLLEDELDVPLFERLSNGVRLTDAGRVLLEGAKKILEEVDWLTARTKRAHQGQLGLLRIASNAIGMRSQGIFASINSFRQQFPNAELKLTIAKSPTQLQDLRSGKLDVGLLFDRPENDAEFDHLLIQEHHLSLILLRTHALAAAHEIRLADLKNEPFVLMPRALQPVVYDRFMASCLAAGIYPENVQEANDEQTILYLVAAGLGVSVMFSPHLIPLPPGVVIKEVPDLSVAMRLELVWKHSNKSSVLKRFVETVEAISMKKEDSGHD